MLTISMRWLIAIAITAPIGIMLIAFWPDASAQANAIQSAETRNAVSECRAMIHDNHSGKPVTSGSWDISALINSGLYYSDSFNKDLLNVLEPLGIPADTPSMTRPSNDFPSAGDVATLQADCDAVGTRGSVWPANDTWG